MVATMREICRKTKNEELKGILIGMCFLAFLVAVWSALLGYGRLRKVNREMWTEETESLGAWIAANTPKKAVFVGCPTEFNAVSVIAGKVLYCSTSEVEWRLGYWTDERSEEVRRLLANLDLAEIAPKVKYIVNVKGHCPELNIAKYQGNAWEVVFRSGNYTVVKRKSDQ
jgi:hypothetical protein